MKLSNKFKFSVLGLTTALVSPALVLPLINATKVTKSISNSNQANVSDLKVQLTDKSYLIYKFEQSDQHKDWGTYAVLNTVYIDGADTIENLAIPSQVINDGVYYKLRYIDTNTRLHGTGNINRLDFSHAEWLDWIKPWSFKNGGLSGENNGDKVKIRTVNFIGAKRLRIIDDGVFCHQYFDSSYGSIDNKIIDLSQCPLLTKIGWDCFNSCCDDNKNDFNAIIFPPSIRTIGENAFSTSNEKCRIRFHKVVFTDPEPKDNLFIDGIPRVVDKNALGIVVPFGSKEKYTRLGVGFDLTYAKNIHESSIKFNKQKGSKKLSVVTSDVNGVDKNYWMPEDKDGKLIEGCKYWLSDTFGGNLSIDEKGYISWKHSLPIGENNVTVYSYRYDDDTNKLLSIVQEQLVISVFEAQLVGGSTTINAVVGPTSQDTSTWEVKIDTSKGASVPTNIKYSIAYASDTIKEVIQKPILDATGFKCTIGWDALEQKHLGQHLIVLQAIVENGSGNTIKLYKQINFNVLAYYDKISLKFKMNGGNFEDYSGGLIEISNQDQLEFQLTMPKGWSKIDPLLSIDGITLTDKQTTAGGETTYKFKFNDDGHKKAEGLYQFYAHTTAKQGETAYDVYSDMFNIWIAKGTETEIKEIPSEIDIAKAQAGSKSFKIVDNPLAMVSSVYAVNAPWASSDTRLIDQSINVIQDPDDKQSILISWTDQYSPSTTKPYDVLDIMLNIHVQYPDTNEYTNVQKTISIVATNKGVVTYESGDKTISAHPTKSVTSPSAFKYKINQDTNASDITWQCYCTSHDELNDPTYLRMVRNDDTSANLICDLTSAEAQAAAPNGKYDILVYAVDSNNLALGYTNVILDVSYGLDVIGLPQKIEITANQAGKYKEPIISLLGGSYIEKPTYTIKGLGENVWVDENGYISWNDKIPETEQELVLEASATYEEKTYTATKYFWLKSTAIVTPEAKKTNVGAIVGGTVGGSAAVGGATAGGIIGGRKRKLRNKGSIEGGK